jgi:acetyl esterase
MRWFAAHYLSGDERDPANPLVSPLLADDLSGLPPALVVTAECDPLRDEGEAYAERLREAGVDAVTSRYDGMIHGYVALPALLPIAVSATVEQCGWTLKSAFGR